MSRSFEVELINGKHGDPAVHVTIQQTGQHILVDMGDIQNLSKRLLHRTDYLLVSHAHMDHFAGFDTFLRSHIPHRRLVQVLGPENIAKQICRKIKAYTWNLIDEDQLTYKVFEIRGNRIFRSASFSRGSNFEFTYQDESIQTLNLERDLSLNFVALDHQGIDSIAYKINLPERIKVDVEKMTELNLKPGPWISTLQAMSASERGEAMLVIDEISYSGKDLVDRLFQSYNESMVYITDAGFSTENICRLKQSLGSCSYFLCESSFRHIDRDRAVAKSHLTTRQAALLAVLLNCHEFEVFHFSNIYKGSLDLSDEALKYWDNLKAVDSSSFVKLVEEEATINT